MKFLKTFSFVALAANAEERKVPPRQPFQRLLTLKKYTQLWIEKRVGEDKPHGINRPIRAQNMITKGLGRLVDRMNEVVPVPHGGKWGKPVQQIPFRAGKDCYFFDKTVQYGGPNPASNRKRRGAWVDREMSRIQREIDESNEPDIFDEYFDSFENPGTDRNQQEKALFEYIIAQEDTKVWRQIGTGFKKFILRYMADCGGEKNFQYHSRRLNKIHTAIKVAYADVRADQDATINDDYVLDED